MGGPGSGSGPRWSAKIKVETCCTLDATTLFKKEMLQPSSGRYATRLVWTRRSTGERTASIGVAVDTMDRPHVRLYYTLKSLGERIDYEVTLDSTEPHFGGVRWWFICPLRGCYRRCAKIHLPPGGRYFGCRVCYDLAYESQWETRSERMLRRADKIRERLGGDDLFPEFTPPKPRGMHWTTYSRLACEERWLRENAWSVFALERGLVRHPDLLQELDIL